MRTTFTRFLKKILRMNVTNEIAKSRMEFIVSYDRSESDALRIKQLTKKLNPILDIYTEQTFSYLSFAEGNELEYVLHIPAQYIRISKEEENEYCFNRE